jgi:hypothetical protein
VEFGQERSHLRSGKSRSYDDGAERVTDETDPFGIEIIALQIAEDLRDEPVRHGVERAECPTLYDENTTRYRDDNILTTTRKKEAERIKICQPDCVRT